MKLFKNLIAKFEKPAAPPPPPSPEPRRTITQDYMEHYGPKPSSAAGLLAPPARSNRMHPLGGQG